MSVPLHVHHAGACCAVGYNLPAACAAIRGRLDHFANSRFRDAAGQPLIAAALPLTSVWGAQRLIELAEHAVVDCMADGWRPEDAPDTLLVFLTPEPGRPDRDPVAQRRCIEAVQARLKLRFHPGSRIVPWGRAGIGPALKIGKRQLAEGEVGQIMILGADSYLNVTAIEHYLDAERLLDSENSDGFIPGEAAAAVVLGLEPVPGRCTVRGIGLARESATPQGDAPNLAHGLSLALRRAAAKAGQAVADCHLRVADVSGEAFFLRETILALGRVLERRVRDLPLWHLSDTVGEVGAAIGPLTLAWLSRTLPRGHLPGRRALAHFANDDGARSALIVDAAGR